MTDPPLGPLDLVTLDRDHPGFRDPEYRARRNVIAALATNHRIGDPISPVEYTDVEHRVWSFVLDELAPLHERYACTEFALGWPRLGIDRTRIPQFADVNEVLNGATGFTMVPVAGLVSPRTFMSHLRRGVFLATQYVRHHSAPLYTPEPDVIHEIVGHAALLSDPDLAELNRLFGEATDRSADDQIDALIRLYWYALEFGVVGAGSERRVIGAGLLSSFGELGRFETEVELRPFDLDAIARTPFDPTDYQRILFVAESTEKLLADLRAFLSSYPRSGQRSSRPPGGRRG